MKAGGFHKHQRQCSYLDIAVYNYAVNKTNVI